MKALRPSQAGWKEAERRLREMADAIGQTIAQGEREYGALPPPSPPTELAIPEMEVEPSPRWWDRFEWRVLADEVDSLEEIGEGRGATATAERPTPEIPLDHEIGYDQPPPLPAARLRERAVWHYEDDGVARGPVSERELRSLRDAGGIGPETLVWRKGMETWRPLRDTPLASADSGDKGQP